MNHLAIPGVVLLLALGGCNDQVDSVDDTIFKDQVHALEKSKQVEKQVLDAAERRRHELEEQLDSQP